MDTPSQAVRETAAPGRGLLLCDGWYDGNEAIGMIYDNGYVPVVRPSSGR
ncbi:MAG: hypothetical protein QXI97_05285 [Nitrososphaerota archaeon]